jgi:UDP-N-acetylglucosamine 4,6-dehydratase/5-epimerase
MLTDKSLLITGGTGSFGRHLTEIVLERFRPARLIVFSRDELKQSEMRQRFNESQYPCMRYFIGDVRDRDRLYRAFDGVDVVVHAAALKHITTAEYNPLEAVKTNVLGAANVIDAAIDRGVAKVVALSTDKAASPTSLYGATKLCADKLFVAANSYACVHPTRFSVVRYGNVMGSRGSVIPLFQRLRPTGALPITDPRMTRFWITLEQGVDFVLQSLERMIGGETFVPKLPSMKITDVAAAVAPECELQTIGIRPGEKLHEVMVSDDDARQTLDCGDFYTVVPVAGKDEFENFRRAHSGTPCPDGFRYSSDTNSHWLSVDELRRMLDPISVTAG